MDDNRIVGIGYNSMPYDKGGCNDRLFTWENGDTTVDLSKKHEDLNLKYLYGTIYSEIELLIISNF